MARKIEDLDIGSTFYSNRSKCHIVGFCNTFEDKENVLLVVYKYWLKYKRYWRYGVIEDWRLQHLLDDQENNRG